MNVQDIVAKAMIEYDTDQPTIRYLLKNTYLEALTSTNEAERTKFIFIDKDTDKVVLETEVEILAVFYDKYNVWSWSWALPGLKNAENYLSKNLLIYALKLGSDLSYVKSLLTTSRGVIKDNIQIDINLAIAASFLKQSYIYPFIYVSDNYHLIYYFILLNKPELDKLRNHGK